MENDYIPHNKPTISSKEISQVVNILESGWINYGQQCRILENTLTNIVNPNVIGNRVVACSNGTSALYLALMSLNVGVGDEVILPSYSCTALLNAIFLTGANPVLVDIDYDCLSCVSSNIEPYISSKVKAIIMVHTFGIVNQDVSKLMDFGIPIIEDCCQALGCSFNSGQSVGSIGDFAIFSFYATKFITGGYGGAVFSKKEEHDLFIRDYINFDMPDSYKPRFNFQLSDINASIINAQLEQLAYFIEKRKKIATSYKEAIIGLNIFPSDNFFRFILNLNNESDVLKVKEIFTHNKIKTIIPIENRELLHRYLKLKDDGFGNSLKASQTTLSIPIYPTLTHNEINKTIRVLQSCL
jgi:perosamine synthetase